jgi:hypothetical protein
VPLLALQALVNHGLFSMHCNKHCSMMVQMLCYMFVRRNCAWARSHSLAAVAGGSLFFIGKMFWFFMMHQK